MNHNETEQIVDIGPEEQKELLTKEVMQGRISVPERGVLILQS